MIDKSKTPILISMPRSGSHYVGNYIREHYKSNGMLFPSIWSSEIFSNHGIEIVVGMIFTVLATLFYRVIYFSYFHKKTKKVESRK